MGKGIIIAFILIVLGIGLVLFVLPLLGVFTTTSAPRASPTPGVTVLSHTGAVDTRSGTYVVQGIAKNTGSSHAVKVYIVVTTYDTSGVDLGSAYDALLDLDPGEEAAFQVEARPLYNGIRVARYNIVPNYDLAPGIAG